MGHSMSTSFHKPPSALNQHSLEKAGRAGSSVSFSNHNDVGINKYASQTKMAAEQMHPIRGDPARLNQPIAIELDHMRDTVPVKNQKMFRNVAAIEIGELKDALAYAERLLARNMEEREDLMKRDAEHQFEMKRAEDRLGAANKARENAESEVTRLNDKFK